MKVGLNQEKRILITEAIKRNEIKTAGEIYCVVARKSDDYRIFVLLWAAVLAIIVPLVFAILGIDLGNALKALGGNWENFNNSAINSNNIYVDLSIQTAILLTAAVLSQFESVVLALTPNFIKRQGVHKFARDQFLAHGIHQTDEKTGVLIYVSLAEHIVEIVADSGIYRKVDKSVWGDAIGKILAKTKSGDLAEGLVLGIDEIGEILAAHFPPTPENPNEISDSVVFI